MAGFLKHIRPNRYISGYLIVGVLAFLAEYLSFIGLITVLHGSYALTIAQTLSFLAGLLTSFLGNRNFTFNSKRRSYAHSQSIQALRYITLAIVNLFITNALIYVLVHFGHILPMYAKVVVMLSVVIWNYLIFRRYIFQTK